MRRCWIEQESRQEPATALDAPSAGCAIEDEASGLQQKNEGYVQKRL